MTLTPLREKTDENQAFILRQHMGTYHLHTYAICDEKSNLGTIKYLSTLSINSILEIACHTAHFSLSQ